MTKNRRTTLIACLALAVLGVGAFAQGSTSVRAFFWLERSWSNHKALQRGADTLVALEPFLRRIHFLRPVRIEVEPGVSFLLDPQDLVPLTILKTGEWQPEVWNSLAPTLSQGSVFFDVGAHIGYYSMKASKRVGSTGHVVAFEPNPETLKLLRDNVTANHFQNVIVEPIACTDREQVLTFFAAPEANTGASSLARENAQISATEAARPYSVRGRPIDDVVRELGLTRVDAIKIDVEGAELLVLRGAINTLKRFHPKLAVEVVARQLASFQTTPDELASFIRSTGYNLARPLDSDETDWEWSMQEPRQVASTIQMADVSASGQLIRGFNGVEQKTWRWTAGRFTAALRPPPGGDTNGAWLLLKFVIPDVSFNKLGPITLSAGIDGTSLAPETFATPGEHMYRSPVPASALRKDIVEANFTLDKFLPAKDYGRELGIVATSVGLEAK